MGYASFSKRFLAFFIDCIVVYFGVSIVMAFVPSEDTASGMLFTVVFSQAAAIIIFILYSALFESSQRQATPGKIVMGIKAVTADGGRLNFPRALTRAVIKDISTFLPFLFFICIFTKKKQNLHDFAARSYVINKTETAAANEKALKIITAVIITAGICCIAFLIFIFSFAAKEGMTFKSIETVAAMQNKTNASSLTWPKRNFADIFVTIDLPFTPKRDLEKENSLKNESENIADIIIYNYMTTPFNFEIQYITLNSKTSLQNIMEKYGMAHIGATGRQAPQEEFTVETAKYSGFDSLAAVRVKPAELPGKLASVQRFAETMNQDTYGIFDKIAVIREAPDKFWVIHGSSGKESAMPFIEKAMYSVEIIKTEIE